MVLAFAQQSTSKFFHISYLKQKKIYIIISPLNILEEIKFFVEMMGRSMGVMKGLEIWSDVPLRLFRLGGLIYRLFFQRFFSSFLRTSIPKQARRKNEDNNEYPATSPAKSPNT